MGLEYTFNNPEQQAEYDKNVAVIQAVFDQRFRLIDFANWIISLDDDDPDSSGRKDRQTVTLNQIVIKAREALG